jgi:DNA modification methylase
MPTERFAPDLRRHAVPLADLSADPANLRLHDDRSIEGIKASLRRFGQQKPVVVDAHGSVIAGNGLLEAARQLGWAKIAAVRSDLGGAERVGYAIADNRTPELSTWDEPALRSTLAEMTPDLVEAAGYTQDELEALLRAPTGGGETSEDEAPDPLPRAVARPGEIWHLGAHRLLCGDSTKPEDVDRLLGGVRAALCATDPPYLVDYTGERPRHGERDSGKDWSGVYHEIDIGDAEGFFRGLFENVKRVLMPKAAVYCWHAHRRCGLIQRIWEELGILDHQQIIWVKPTSVFGRVYWHFRHEPCMMGWVKGSQPAHDNDHAFDSVWEIDWEGKSKIIGNEHPTQKPVEIFARPMRKHTAEGDVCFEPFSGSGSQISAAEQLGRRCYAIEIEPVFVDVAIRRWQALTGQAARLGADGPTWDDRARDVGAEETAPCPPSPPSSAATPAARGRRRSGTATSTPPSTPKSTPGGRRKGRRTRGGTARRGADSGG